MANQLITGNRVRVTVGGQVFEIPQEKQFHLMSLLQQWQGVSIPENQNQNKCGFNGSTLICG